MPRFDLDKLPQTILVNIERTQEGNFIAELPELKSVFTQAENLELLDSCINDLIMSYFDVPKQYHNSIWYKKTEDKSEAESIKAPLHFQILLAPNLPNSWR